MDKRKILDRINTPEDLKSLSIDQLESLALEIRELIMQVVSRNGGHLASNLGTVELTLALHRVFYSPRDKIIWDVGHQCYTHKLITGRKDRFGTLRKLGGLSGFPKRSESPHDIFDTGHASTSISAALGLMKGQQLRGREGKIIAVIGDGALTGGMALEGLNQAGQLGKDLIIVLNDNNMSIGDNVGAISSYLTRLAATRQYQFLKKRFDRGVRRIPLFGRELLRLIQRIEKGLKALLLRESLFSDLGLEYIGPIDGHNLRTLEKVFRNAREMERPVVVHVSTIKGRGYIHAEGDPTLYHGVAPFSIVDGKIESKGYLTYTEAFSDIITKFAEKDERIVGITAAMADGTGLRLFQTLYPRRFFDVGIAEQHAVTFAAGLAIAGMRPVVAIYSTFLQRAVDQVVHDVALTGQPVVFAVDRAGLVGADGETHHGLLDIALFRSVPGLTIMAPADRTEMEIMFRQALNTEAPVMIRYPRAPCDTGGLDLSAPLVPGRGLLIRSGAEDGKLSSTSEVLIVSFGGLVREAVEAAGLLADSGIEADIYNLRFIKPLDEEYLLALVSRYSLVCLCEEGYLSGGIGEHIAGLFREQRLKTPFIHLGIEERFIQHGTRRELLSMCGLDAQHIAEAIEHAPVLAQRLRIYRNHRG